jgi:ubiquinone biosynthesis protein UbiJ
VSEDPLANVLGRLSAEASRQMLRLDPETQARLKPLCGRVIEFQATEPALTWHLTIEESGIAVKPGAHTAPHAIVRGRAKDLTTWLLGGPASSIVIDGDSAMLAEFAMICRDYVPDFATPLNALVGSEIAETLVGTAEMGLRGLASALEGIAQSMQDRAHESFVAQPQFEDFLTRVDDLRLRVDRLAAEVSARESGAEQSEIHD